MKMTDYKNRITPDNITELKPNETLVVPTNEAGRHGAGLAKFAAQRFGLKYGHYSHVCSASDDVFDFVSKMTYRDFTEIKKHAKNEAEHAGSLDSRGIQALPKDKAKTLQGQQVRRCSCGMERAQV